MKVRMKVGVSGSRSGGQPWPPIGEEITVPDHEGKDLCAAGLAEPVAASKEVETRPAEGSEEEPKRRSRSEGKSESKSGD